MWKSKSGKKINFDEAIISNSPIKVTSLAESVNFGKMTIEQKRLFFLQLAMSFLPEDDGYCHIAEYAQELERYVLAGEIISN
jgi:hypothetical protein